MKDTGRRTRQNGTERPGDDAPLSSYTAQQRRVIRQGLRILAKGSAAAGDGRDDEG